METAKTTQPAAVNALTPRAPAHFAPRPFHASRDQAREDFKSAGRPPIKPACPIASKPGLKTSLATRWRM